MSQQQRSFEDRPAVRTAVPLLVGLTGPSGGGKTLSALRLATGIQRVAGGDIFVVDTENRRALHYADTFRFRHVEFSAPFSPLDYLSALEHCKRKGASVVVVDSMSHCHEGPGGVLEWHERLVQERSGGDFRKAERIKLGCWAEPKAARRRLINTLLQLGINFIACFRAKEKLRVIPGKEPVALGWQAIAGEEFIYEMSTSLLLMPGAQGHITLAPEHDAERSSIKVPMQFRSLLKDGLQLDEATGEAMARWAAGAVREHPLLARYRGCESRDGFAELEEARKAAWQSATPEEKAALKGASEAAAERVRAAQEQPAGEQPSERPADTDASLEAL